MYKKLSSIFIVAASILTMSTINVSAEVVNIPRVENIELNSPTSNSNNVSRIGNRVPTNLSQTSGANNPFSPPSFSTKQSGVTNENSSSNLGSNHGEMVGSNPQTYQVPGYNNTNVSPPNFNNVTPPTYNAPISPSYSVDKPNMNVSANAPNVKTPSTPSLADTNAIDKNARELGNVSSSGALSNAENFRLNAQNQAENMSNTLSGSGEKNLMSQINQGARYVNQGGEGEVLDRAGQTITTLGGQIINLLVMGLFYLSIIGVVWCGIRAIIAIFTKDNAWKWLGGAIFSVIIYILIVSLTGVNLQSSAIAEFFNWIINGG